MDMACQGRIYSTAEKHLQPCEIILNIAEYATDTFFKNYATLQTYTCMNISKELAQNGSICLFNI
jgi:hypothetical protein